MNPGTLRSGIQKMADFKGNHLPNMHTISFRLIYLATLICQVLSAPPLQPQVPSSDDLSVSAANSLTQCTTQTWKTMSTANCHLAIRALPSTHLNGTFHTGGELTDPFRVPKYGTRADCSIRVELVDNSVEDNSTWVSVRAAVSELAIGCTSKSDVSQSKGGLTRAGEKDGIKITVYNSLGP